MQIVDTREPAHMPAAGDRPNRLFMWLRTHVPRYYLVRFPLLLAILLVAFVPFALFAVPTMFRSMFILSALGLTFVSFFLSVAAFTVMATRRLTLLYGPCRFSTLWEPWPAPVGARALLGHFLVAVPAILAASWLSATEGGLRWGAIVYAGLGVLFAAGLMWIAAAVQDLLTNPFGAKVPNLVVPLDPVRMKLQAHEIGRLAALVSWFKRRFGWLSRRIRPYLGPGYLDDAGRLLPGHVFALSLFGLFGIVYAFGALLGRPGTARGAEVPALAFLLITATLWTWLLSAVAFYVDRHRVPVLIWVVVLSFLSWAWWRSDYYFSLVPPTGDWSRLEDPAAIADNREHPLLTVVAVDGGAIQAAAWGARVLTGVQEAWPEFRQSARLISATSGGSVGVMYFVSALQRDRPPAKQDLDQVMTLATRGSLNEVGWGFAYPDLWRTFLPGLPFVKDRGWALQQAWEREWLVRLPHLGARSPQLSDWVNDVREGWKPAVSFNSVEVESGQRFSFATFAPPYEWGLSTLGFRYPASDVTVSTAVRLSATFPYVTPIARADPASLPGQPEPYAGHFADGGYYDNTGMGIAMRWLDRALSNRAPTDVSKVVAFVRIRSAPDVGSAPAKRAGGWLYQVAGPVQTLANVRTTAQRDRALAELEFLQRMWCQNGIEIRSFEFAFERPQPPLSWQLSPPERAAIEREWNDHREGERNKATLESLLQTAHSPNLGKC